MFNFFNSNFDKVAQAFDSAQSLSEVHACKKSKLQLFNHPKWGASLTNGDDDGINRLPNGFRCQLPDGTSWAVDGKVWKSMAADKQRNSKVKGGDQW